MKSFKFALSLSVLALGLLGSAQAFAVDETRCSGKGCLDVPMQPLMHTDSHEDYGNAEQVIYSEGEMQLIMDANGYPVMQTDGHSL